MDTLTPQQATDLANSFLQVSKTVADFRYAHLSELSEEENQQLIGFQQTIMDTGERILAISATLEMNNASSALSQINSVASRMGKDVHFMQDVQRCINVAATFVLLGGAIISQDIDKIDNAINSLTNL